MPPPASPSSRSRGKAVGVLLSRRQALALAGLVPLARVAHAEEGPSPDATARWLAGIVPVPGLEPSGDWRTYAKTEEERWLTTGPRLKTLTSWSGSELRGVLPAEPTLFYPFAGPDVLHAVALFPTAKRILLVGLEPVGNLPGPGAASTGFFTRLGAALADVHRLTFFRTQEMASDFQRDGVLPALVALVARMNGRVISVERFPASSNPPSPASARIAWTTSSGEARKIEYIQADLSNAGMKTHPSLAAAIRGSTLVTFVKAAMYLLPDPRFSTLRQQILDESAVVVEDDTGIPYRFFSETAWVTRIFGRYEAPGPPFETWVQPDLRAAFERRAPPLLPFGLGYHIEPRRSNLLVAAKVRG
jgi:hypothetical protein